MPDLHIARAAAFAMPEGSPPETLRALKQGLSRSAQRRMTRCGLMVRHVLREFEIGDVDTIVYQTAYSEARTIEKYVDGYPEPSPLSFQASIHPSAVQQVLIEQQSPLPLLVPVANAHGPGQAIRTLEWLAPEGMLVLAEEEGSWLREAGLACSHSFALALQTTTNPDAAMAHLTFNSTYRQGSFQDTLTLMHAIQQRSNWTDAQSDLSLKWK